MNKLAILLSGVAASGLLTGACSDSDDGEGGSRGKGGAGGGAGMLMACPVAGMPGMAAMPGVGGTTGAGGMSGTGGASSAGMSAAGAAGAPPMAPPCNQIPLLARGDAGFSVTSPEFASCMPIPAEHTCDQKPFPQGTSFAFSWTAGPSGTQSYAVVFKDLAVIARTAPTDSNYNKGFHWVMWDIPPTTTTLPAAMKPGHLYPDIPGVRQWSNFNNYAFFGPCPNFDPATDAIYNDTYAVVVYALPFAKASILPPTMGISTVRQLDDYFNGTALSVAEYRGTSNAHASEIPEGVLPPMTMPPCPTTCQLATACLAGQ